MSIAPIFTSFLHVDSKTRYLSNKKCYVVTFNCPPVSRGTIGLWNVILHRRIARGLTTYQQDFLSRTENANPQAHQLRLLICKT